MGSLKRIQQAKVPKWLLQEKTTIKVFTNLCNSSLNNILAKFMGHLLIQVKPIRLEDMRPYNMSFLSSNNRATNVLNTINFKRISLSPLRAILLTTSQHLKLPLLLVTSHFIAMSRIPLLRKVALRF